MTSAPQGANNEGGESRPQSFWRSVGLILFGLVGVGILISLCIWQLQRLEWKLGVIETLEARLAAPPQPLPEILDKDSQEFSRVRLEGRFEGQRGAHGFTDAPLLTARKFLGPGYRVIQPFTLTDGRVVMVDRGYVPIAEKNENGAAALPTKAFAGVFSFVGVLRWPEEEVEGRPFGPNDNVWTARDMEDMAELFSALPVLVVADEPTAEGRWPEPQPLRAVAIKNDHLEYAITWALLALVWAIMTGALLLRLRR